MLAPPQQRLAHGSANSEGVAPKRIDKAEAAVTCGEPRIVTALCRQLRTQ
nr:hypothetical protein [Mycobacterium sp.]